MRRVRVVWGLAIAVVLLGAAAVLVSCVGTRHGLVGLFSPTYDPAPKAAGEELSPAFDEVDEALPRIAVALTEVGTGFIQTTDIQFVPEDPKLMIVLEKAGTAKWLDLGTGKSGTWFQVRVLDDSEQGLLGLAFHPKFTENGRFYINHVTRSDGEDVTRVAEWTVPPGSDLRETTPREARTIINVEQPYQNHNAGQLQFGPDGFLYLGLGDGGWRDDPHGHGQNTETLLGTMMRIDVDRTEGGKQYAVPQDNPFVGKPGFLSEIWAYGLRNPWRYSFDPEGRLITGDVGQNLWEEVDIVPRGGNLGWKIREAAHCFEPEEGCRTEGLVEPIFEYGREEGGSVTGGYVALSDAFPALRGKYVFGDFLSGRLWALELPAEPGQRAKAHALGRWPILPSTFGRDDSGAIYVSDYPDMGIYRIDPAGGPGGS